MQVHQAQPHLDVTVAEKEKIHLKTLYQSFIDI